MQTVNILLVRAIQIIACMFFTSAVLIYAGALLLVPLAVLKAIVSLLADGIGFNGIFATIIAVPALFWLGLRVKSLPGVTSMLVDTGWALVRMGVENFRKFDDIARAIKGPKAHVAASNS